jgi:dTDP-4-amino-4,6-dideoxygalactose transaminase
MCTRVWPRFEEDEIEAAVAVLRSGRVNYWTGEEVRNFEREFAELCGAAYGVALANGTVALELALLALCIGRGHDVIVTARSFVASATCVVNVGARPVFADVDMVSQNVTAETIAAALTEHTKAIICVHLAGWPCDMDYILDLARERGIAVIEDCAQAHGAQYKGRPVGALGDVGVFSFCQDKIMTTAGEGGMLVTNDPALFERAWSYKDHGKNRLIAEQRQLALGYRWMHDGFGTNWRMTEIQAAVGRIQLRKLAHWVSIRRRNATILDEALANVDGLRLAIPGPDFGHAYYKYYVFLELPHLRVGWSRSRIIQAVRDKGISCLVGACPEIYREAAFAHPRLQPARRLPVARHLGETSLMLLVDPTISADDMDRTASILHDILTEATLWSG